MIVRVLAVRRLHKQRAKGRRILKLNVRHVDVSDAGLLEGGSTVAKGKVDERRRRNGIEVCSKSRRTCIEYRSGRGEWQTSQHSCPGRGPFVREGKLHRAIDQIADLRI